MSTSNFQDRLTKALDFSEASSGRYGKAYDALKGITKSIADEMNREWDEGLIKIEIEPGFTSTMGRQLNVILSIPAKSFRTTLFRAYVPDSGFPMSLDLFGEEAVTCEDEQRLEEQMLDFLDKTKDGMRSYREYAQP